MQTQQRNIFFFMCFDCCFGLFSLVRFFSNCIDHQNNRTPPPALLGHSAFSSSKQTDDARTTNLDFLQILLILTYLIEYKKYKTIVDLPPPSQKLKYYFYSPFFLEKGKIKSIGTGNNWISIGFQQSELYRQDMGFNRV